jgi:single-strand DNA-binding protein
MAASLNKLQLIGNIGAAAEVRAAGESSVASFSLATTERWKDRETQERKERTEWHRVEVWGGLAGVVSQYGRKGGLVYVEGKLKTEKYTDKEGVERYSTKVRADEVTFLDREDKKGAGASLNMIQLIGRLGADPEMRYIPTGTPVASFSVATTETWKDRRSQERVEQTEWHRVEAWEGLAEIVSEFGRKGGLIYVEGTVRAEKYTDKDGIERYTTKVRATRVTFLDRAPKDGEQSDDGAGAPEQERGDQQQGGEGAGAPAAQAPAAAQPAAASAPADAARKPYDLNRFRKGAKAAAAS